MAWVNQILWSSTAQKQRNETLEYWVNRNKSTVYAKKLNLLIKENTLRLLSKPDLGKQTDYNHVRELVIKDYSVFYKNEENSIRILAFWDNRQNPDKLKELLNK